MNAARQYEQEAHNRIDVAVAKATSETQADLFQEFNKLLKHIFESGNGDCQPDELGGRKRHTSAKNLWMTEADAKIRRLDEVNRQVNNLRRQGDEHLHDGLLNAILRQVEGITTRLVQRQNLRKLIWTKSDFQVLVKQTLLA